MTPPIYFDIEMNKIIVTLIVPTVNYFDLEIVFLYKKNLLPKTEGYNLLKLINHISRQGSMFQGKTAHDQ